MMVNISAYRLIAVAIHVRTSAPKIPFKSPNFRLGCHRIRILGSYGICPSIGGVAKKEIEGFIQS
jgi:hypothetical protein